MLPHLNCRRLSGVDERELAVVESADLRWPLRRSWQVRLIVRRYGGVAIHCFAAGRPHPPANPVEVWINPPKSQATQSSANPVHPVSRSTPDRRCLTLRASPAKVGPPAMGGPPSHPSPWRNRGVG